MHARWVIGLVVASSALMLGAGGRGSLAAAPQPAAATAPQAPAQPATASDEGLPVTDAEVQKACGGCHARDDKGRMTRISYRRASPENWELTLRRMMSLNDVPLAPDAARRILKYLSDQHGLAPEEARPAMFDAERRLVDYVYTADQEIHQLCSTCHSMGRVISERRTKDEWVALMTMHRYYYPLIDGASGGFRRSGRGGGTGGRGRGAPTATDNQDTRQPVEKAQDHLAGAFPLMSAEWTSWSAAMRSPRLAGRWALAGYEVGKGPIYGELTIADRPGITDAFVTDGRFAYTRTGEVFARRSRAVVYTGFQWRGRSADTPDDQGTWREVLFIERDGQEIKGRWFTGAHDEIGIDVTLRRVSSGPIVAGTDLRALRAGASGQRLRVFGANLPQQLAPGDLDLGQGIKVSRIVSAAADALAVDLDVAADARLGPRDVSIGGSTRPAAIVVYSRLDGIKVEPQAGMARLGGAAFPKRLQQFEARAFANGPDGRSGTQDDVDLGIVDARWTLEEYSATFKDDDVQFVGELGPNGLFTPNVDGPNPKRSGNRNNVGDVWVVATHAPGGPDAPARPLRARAHLLVTVPLYMDWGPREVGR
jgi:quinohemoprotein amine dehydrogenase